ncbi:hypothetical protein [Escherichia coli]|uniref:hypothetical protein n=1 Tax=Escherichia coli TaxID=562 RepID=UPI00208DD44A|nr:hypothetical protein [Escherichia coli]
MIKAEHAGDTCSAFLDVVNFVVGRTQDFAGSAVVVDVPGVRKNDSEHFTPQLDDVEICCFEAITIPIVCS